MFELLESKVLSSHWFQISTCAPTKWEVVYVAALGATVALAKVCAGDLPQVTFTLAENGRSVPWLRYAGWLITCPVLLIHLVRRCRLTSG